MHYRFLVEALADAFLSSHPDADEIVTRVQRLLRKKWRWVRPLVKRYMRAVEGRMRPRRSEIIRFLRQDRGLFRAYHAHRRELYIAGPGPQPNSMRPDAVATNWNIPAITTIGDLAGWFGISVRELEWFADVKGVAAKFGAPPKIRNYSYRALTKRSGTIRLIEAPKSRLKALQRKILAEILDRVPPHAAAHGFVKGRAIKTFSSMHVGKHVVLKIDLRDFFPSIRAARIQTIFRLLGYPEHVADLLAGLCCTATPREIWKEMPLDVKSSDWIASRELYFCTHLPQGAPTSSALANICCYRVDCRLTGLAEAAGANYTRYADDLAFSGDEDFARHVGRFADHVAAILMDEGFAVNFRKTRVMRKSVRQRLTGMVVNSHANVVRPEFDRLKAILTNCVRHGPETQNRKDHPRWREHLEGRVAFVESVNPAKGAKLRRILNSISWS